MADNNTPKLPVSWGLVSAGRIAHTFAKDMQFVDNAVMHAVAARSLQNAKVFADTYDIPIAYEGYDALYADPDVDAVYISTPHTLHYEHTKRALLAGKHVLCEKPFVVTPEQCQELTALAKQHNLFLMEAMWTWFLPAIEQTLSWINQGRIGVVKQVQADFGYPIQYDPSLREWDTTLAGGCTFEMGIYPIAFNWLVQKRDPIKWQITGKRAPNNADKTVSVNLEYEDSISHIGSSFECKLRNWAYVIGTDGYIAIPDFWRAERAQLFHLDTCLETFNVDGQGSGFEYQIEHASRCIASGQLESDVVSHQDSLSFQRHIQTILSGF